MKLLFSSMGGVQEGAANILKLALLRGFLDMLSTSFEGVTRMMGLLLEDKKSDYPLF